VCVLVVDDDDDARDMVAETLRRQGASVIVASSGFEALEQIERHGPQLLISDIRMPGMDGHELVRRVRRLPRNRGGRVPAIALTSHARWELQAEALDAGFQLYVAKCDVPKGLLEALARARSWLPERRATRSQRPRARAGAAAPPQEPPPSTPLSSPSKITIRKLLDELFSAPGSTVLALSDKLDRFPPQRTLATIQMLARKQLVDLEGAGTQTKVFVKHVDVAEVAKRAKDVGVDIDRTIPRW
jgi:CheY-like chemotaxis protein